MASAAAWANPRVDAFLDYCRPQSGDAVRDSDCQTAARVVASGNSLVARLSGYRVWNRYADGGPDAATVRQGLRDLAWMMRHAHEAPGAAAASRWRTAWLASDGEVAAYRRLMAARGIEVRAPASFAIDASLLDPSR